MYQVKRDLAMMSDPPNILLFYEELVKQFGYIVLFSAIFPLASLMSYISNGIQIKSQITNLQYQRRFKAEVSNGIGSWLGRLESLSQVAIIINCAMCYFTSHVYQGLFVAFEERMKNADDIKPITANPNGWALLDFFLFVVAAEHLLLLLKLLIENLIDDVPEEVQLGGRERQAVTNQFKKAKDEDAMQCKVTTYPEKVRAARDTVLAWSG